MIIYDSVHVGLQIHSLGICFAEYKELEEQALKDVIGHQVALGIDVITDGEILRENYIFHFWCVLYAFGISHYYTCIDKSDTCFTNM